MRKVINPCWCRVHKRKGEGYDNVRGFAKIEFTDGRLSICGVIGPMNNGNCRGSAGQCTDSIKQGTPADGWTKEMLDKLCDIWDRWHLNDMRPYCEHQKELGWAEAAVEEIVLHHYRLNQDAYAKRKDAEKAAIEALRKGEVFAPTKEQTFFAALPASLDIYEPLPESTAQYYHHKKPLYKGDCGATEKKIRGWVRFDESEHGILCKPCPVCGYKYGTSWLKEEVPQEVIDWLFALPDTKVEPAWV